MENSQKSVCGRGSAPDPAGGAHDAPPDPLVGWGGGTPSPDPTPRRLASRCLRHLELSHPPILPISPPNVNILFCNCSMIVYILNLQYGFKRVVLMQYLLYANEFYISHLEVLSYLVCPSILTKHLTEFYTLDFTLNC